MANFASHSATYGSIDAVIVLLLYLFISAAVLLLGAVNAVVYRQIAKGENGPGMERPAALSEPASVPTRLYEALGG